MKPRRSNNARVFVKAGARDVMLNWISVPELELDLVAEEYFRAAKVLVRSYEQAGHNDLAAYPIVANYRHALELFLKAFLIMGHRFSGVPQESDTTTALKEHHLTPLWHMVDRLLNKLGMNGWFGLSGEGLVEMIQELDSVDPRGQSFRYTFRKDGTPTCKPGFRFSVRTLSEAIDPKLDVLSGACLGLREHYRNLASVS